MFQGRTVKTSLRAATQIQKLQIKLSTSPSHSIPTQGQKVPALTPTTPGAWQGSHWSANFSVTGMTRHRKKIPRRKRKREHNSLQYQRQDKIRIRFGLQAILSVTDVYFRSGCTISRKLTDQKHTIISLCSLKRRKFKTKPSQLNMSSCFKIMGEKTWHKTFQAQLFSGLVSELYFWCSRVFYALSNGTTTSRRRFQTLLQSTRTVVPLPSHFITTTMAVT